MPLVPAAAPARPATRPSPSPPPNAGSRRGPQFGIDTVNVDDTHGGERPIHTALLAPGIPIVEHLRGLDDLADGPFRLFAVPPAIEGLGTSIVRAFAPTER